MIMFVFRGFLFVLFDLFTSDFGFAVPIYKTFGGSVVLKPDRTSGPITSVTWKHKTDLALEWFGNEITCYRTFHGRCDLNKETGSFSITNLTSEDSGEYTPEINNVVGRMMELQVIKPVPKPTVSMDCNSEKTVCNLTCEANINAEFGSVTYKWKSGDTQLSIDKKLSITAKNEERSYYCMLINLVSNSASDEISDPISRGNNYAAVIIPVVVLGLVIGAFLLLFLLNRAGYFPSFNKLFPCNETERRRKKDAVQLTDGNSTAVQIDQNSDDAVNVAPEEAEKLLTIQNETNQEQVAVTPNGGFHPVSQENDQDNARPEEESSRLLPDPQTTAEIKSKGKEALNGDQPANVGMNNIDQTVVSIEQQQEDPPTEVSDRESGQKSESEETKPTAEEPEKPNDPTCDLPVDSQPEPGSSQESNLEQSAVSPEPSSQTVSIEQQQQDPPAVQDSDDEGESGQKSESEETKPTAEGPDTLQTETSLPKSTREETHDTDCAES